MPTRWFRLLASREPATSLALFRIACGLTVLASIGTVICHGVAETLWLDHALGGFMELSDPPPWPFALLGGVTAAGLWTMIIVCLAAASCLTLGIAGRSAALITLVSYQAITDLNWDTGGGDDKLIGNALFLLIFARSSATLSLHCRWRCGSWRCEDLVPAWPRYVAVWQLVLVYFTTALQKISIYWTAAGDYAALYYFLQDPSWQRFDMRWLADVFWLTQAATLLVWWWEFSAPLLVLDLWLRRKSTLQGPDALGRLARLFLRLNFRRWFTLFGVAVHVGISLLIGLGPFTWITLSFYLCLYHPSEWRPSAAPNRFSSADPARIRQQPELPRNGPANAAIQGIIALLVSAHLVVITLASCLEPIGAIDDRAQWDDPATHAEFAAWAERLQRLGVDTSADEVKDALWSPVQALQHGETALLTPLRPYFAYCGTRQGWHMFVAPHLEARRYAIEVREGGDWCIVYEQRDNLHRWLASKLEQERVRDGIFHLLQRGNDLELRRLAEWLAIRAAADFPSADALRLRVYHYRLPTPEESRAGEQTIGDWSQSVEVDFQVWRRSAWQFPVGENVAQKS